jgi:hypothetical protein
MLIVNINAAEILKIRKMHGSMDAWMHVDSAVMQSCSHAPMQSCTHAIMHPCNHAIIPVVSGSEPGFFKKT